MNQKVEAARNQNIDSEAYLEAEIAMHQKIEAAKILSED